MRRPAQLTPEQVLLLILSRSIRTDQSLTQIQEYTGLIQPLLAYGLLTQESLKTYAERIKEPSAEFDSVVPESLSKSYDDHCVGSTTQGRAQISNRNKSAGRYYTPAVLSEYLLNKALGIGRGNSDTSFIVDSILDPSCGSGNLLLPALRYKLGQTPPRSSCGTENHVSKSLSSIFGQDIDSHALRICKMLLISECIEFSRKEASPITQEQIANWAHIVTNNIRHGDSLLPEAVKPNEKFGQALPEDSVESIWTATFPQAFVEGGFSLVIANPPFLNGITSTTRTHPERKLRLRSTYASARGAWDEGLLFQELAIRILRPQGRSAFIVPNKFLSTRYSRDFQAYAQKQGQLLTIADCSRERVFQSVGIYPVVCVFEKSPTVPHESRIWVERFKPRGKHTGCFVKRSLEQTDLWSHLLADKPSLIAHLKLASVPISDIFEVRASATTKEAYLLKPYLRDCPPEKNDLKLVTAGAIAPYANLHGLKPIRYLGSTFQSPVFNIDCPIFGKRRVEDYKKPKLILSGLGKELHAAFDDGHSAGAVSALQIIDPNNQDGCEQLFLLLALMNSSIMNWYFRQTCAALSLSGGYLRLSKAHLSEFPYPKKLLEESCNVRPLRSELIDAAKQRSALAIELFTSETKANLGKAIRQLDNLIDRHTARLFCLSS